jgi:hypothetical protein
MSFHDLSNEQKKDALGRGYIAMFASRDSVEEATEYLHEILDTLQPHDKIAVITAFQVLENTKILNEVQNVNV